MPRESTPARHQLPRIDAAALEAARAADRALAVAREIGADRWARYLASIPDRLRDEPVPALRSAGLLVRAAYGPKDSIRDVLPEDVTEPLLRATDRLLKVLARHELGAD